MPGHSPLEHGRYTLDCLNSNRRFTIVCELYSKACDGSRQDGGVRRIAAMLLLGPALDANYLAVKADLYTWPCSEATEETALVTDHAAEQ